MNKKEIVKKLLSQFIYINNDDIECIDWCDNCKNLVVQTELAGSFCCEHCHSENINIVEVRDF